MSISLLKTSNRKRTNDGITRNLLPTDSEVERKRFKIEPTQLTSPENKPFLPSQQRIESTTTPAKYSNKFVSTNNTSSTKESTRSPTDNMPIILGI